MKLAREQVTLWNPITNKNCVTGSSRFMATPQWNECGLSYSCSYCGSMSTEELLECLDSTPKLNFDMADSGQKIYVHRYGYEHAGPIKFYSWHLFDGGRPAIEREQIWYRVRVECQRTWNELTKKMKAPHGDY